MFGSRIAKSVKAALAGCTLIALAGCINTPPVSDLQPPPKGVTPTVNLQPAPKLAPYHLQVGDVLDVKLMLNPELSDEVIVRPDGMISTTIADDVQAYGRTVTEVRDELKQKYSKHLKDPEIALMVRSFAPSRVYVVGEVASPGEFITVGPNLTLVQAIARAGGLKNDAQPDEAVILRRGEGEEPQAYLADYKAAITGADPSSDIRLEPYDVVVVPRSGVGDVYLYFEQYLQQFVPASFGMSYQLNPTTSATTQ